MVGSRTVTTLSLAAALVLVLVAAFGATACTQDFEKFEGAGSEDASTEGDAASADGSTRPAVDGGSCAQAADCVASMTTCRTSCEETQTDCFDRCGDSGRCRRDCQNAFDGCESRCQSTCRSCAASCPNVCQLGDRD